MGASGRSELSQIRTKREMKQLSIGSRVTLRTDDANEILAGLYPHNWPISAYFEGGSSFRTSVRILVSLLTRRSNERRGEASGRERRYISTTCCAVSRESIRPANPARVDDSGVLGGGAICRD